MPGLAHWLRGAARGGATSSLISGKEGWHRFSPFVVSSWELIKKALALGRLPSVPGWFNPISLGGLLATLAELVLLVVVVVAEKKR